MGRGGWRKVEQGSRGDGDADASAAAAGPYGGDTSYAQQQQQRQGGKGPRRGNGSAASAAAARGGGGGAATVGGGYPGGAAAAPAAVASPEGGGGGRENRRRRPGAGGREETDEQQRQQSRGDGKGGGRQGGKGDWGHHQDRRGMHGSNDVAAGNSPPVVTGSSRWDALAPGNEPISRHERLDSGWSSASRPRREQRDHRDSAVGSTPTHQSPKAKPSTYFVKVDVKDFYDNEDLAGDAPSPTTASFSASFGMSDERPSGHGKKKDTDDNNDEKPERAKDVVFAEIRGVLEICPVLQSTDFDFRIRQQLHAFHGAGGRARIHEAMVWIKNSTQSKLRSSVKNWPAYILALLKKFEMEAASNDRQARARQRVAEASTTSGSAVVSPSNAEPPAAPPVVPDADTAALAAVAALPPPSAAPSLPPTPKARLESLPLQPPKVPPPRTPAPCIPPPTVPLAAQPPAGSHPVPPMSQAWHQPQVPPPSPAAWAAWLAQHHGALAGVNGGGALAAALAGVNGSGALAAALAGVNGNGAAAAALAGVSGNGAMPTGMPGVNTGGAVPAGMPGVNGGAAVAVPSLASIAR